MSGVTSDSLDQIKIYSPTTSGKIYTFRYRVKNIYDWSVNYSPSLGIISATVPTKPLNVQTANSLVDDKVIITWDAPSNPGGIGVTIT